MSSVTVVRPTGEACGKTHNAIRKHPWLYMFLRSIFEWREFVFNIPFARLRGCRRRFLRIRRRPLERGGRENLRRSQRPKLLILSRLPFDPVLMSARPMVKSQSLRLSRIGKPI
jgi:hypothetical protein